VARVDEVNEWDAVAASWLRERPQRLWRAHSDAVNSTLIGGWLRSDSGPVLKTDLWDEAVGAGVYEALVERAESVVGIDISPVVVAGAAERCLGLEAVVADVAALPFPDGRFDTVVSISTLDHLDSHARIERALAEIHRVLRPGGSLLLTLDNAANPLLWLSRAAVRLLNHRRADGWRLAERLGLWPYDVGATYSRRGIVQALQRAGFAVEATAAILHTPRFPAILLGELLERHPHERAERALLNGLRACEGLGALPSRFVTGYFVAVRAVRD
jgi:SAM-dependent methyltransferase